jgi:3-dehydroquinate dehydratase/shikimate dehydrogenase
MVADEASALADAQAARDAGADLVELRIDEVFSGSAGPDAALDEREVASILRLVAACPLPCIVTCRSAAEGGAYDGDDAARVALYERLGTAGVRSDPAAPGQPREHPPRYLDIEHAAYARSANLKQKVHLAVDYPTRRRDVRPGLILSMHDFAGRPADLLRRVGAMGSEPAASVVKVAVTARSVRDNLELFDLLAENAAGRPTIALAMGRFGLMSRVLAPKFGGFLTFASLRPQSATAPGQPTVRELVDVYRFRDLHPRTRVYALLGWPVEHSLSPLVHNAGFDALTPDSWEREGTPGAGDRPTTHDGVYLPLPVPPEYEHFKATLGALIDHPRLDFSGCSVTLPHKEHLVRFARERLATDDDLTWSVDAVSLACGAANTLVVERDRLGSAVKARVLNTDASAATALLSAAVGSGAVSPVAASPGAEKPLAGKAVALLGAGGVARSVAAGVMLAGGRVLVVNRTPERARALADGLRAVGALRAHGGAIDAISLTDLARTPVAALVNCTPVGMHAGPDPDGLPADPAEALAASPDAVVMDTVYTPAVTPLLAAAKGSGRRTIGGQEMFVRQAGEQFAAWTGRPAPLRLFERICREALGV